MASTSPGAGPTPLESSGSDHHPSKANGLLLWTALPLLLAQAFIPLDEFVHRGDDAFYYFKVAANYPRLGIWSFDGIHPTNGVQPLWAMLLSGIALLLARVGVTDPPLLARVFVFCAALLQFASSMVLFHILARMVSVGTALAAAGAFLFPMGIVWARVWGMENSLYATVLLSTIAYFHFGFGERRSLRSAAMLGLLLGLTALCRLNATLLIPCLALALLADRRHGRLASRIRLVAVAGGVASAVLVPYLLSNLVTTGHFLPVSGLVKDIQMIRGLEAAGIESQLSWDFVTLLYRNTHAGIGYFLTSRAVDAMWLLGSRVVADGASTYSRVLGALALLALGPLALGRPASWFSFLAGHYARLAPFWYLLLFGFLDAAVSVVRYPFQLRYAVIRWWLVPDEIVVVVLVATLVTAAVSYGALRIVPQRLHAPLTTAVIALLVVFHAQQTIRFYWDGSKQIRDWNPSWNDESYRAAQWINANLPADAVVGSWNAGVVGYYSTRRVVNLDGLINSVELLPYLRDDRIADYIRSQGIRYLSDMESSIARSKAKEVLELTEVYRRHSDLMQEDYRIYRVGAAAAPPRSSVALPARAP